MQLIAKVRRFVRRHDLISPATRVVCAVSGGSDSVALARIAADLAAAGDATFVGIAHLDHQLRQTADRDADFCRALADRLQRPILVERADVRSRAHRDGTSIEHAAHDVRYEFFARARVHFDADVVALGHTRDDQAETFLLRLIRGAGARGLASMYPRIGHIVRPLLDCGREELRAFLADRAESFVDDETNADVTIPRNRVRTRLMPLLASEFNPNIVEILAHEAELSREMWLWLESEIARLGDARGVDALRAAPLALRRLMLWRAMTNASAGRPVTFDHVAAALALLDAQDGAAVDAPGHRVQRKGGQLVLTNRPDASGSNLFWYSLSIPGEVVDSQRGFRVSVETAEPNAATSPASADVGRGATAVVRRDLIGGALAVRNRRPGDRFRPVGLPGRKKLQDLFVDRKIARAERDSVPIVVDDRDRIIWVAGHGIDAAFQVTDPAQAVLILKLKAVGGSA